MRILVKNTRPVDLKVAFVTATIFENNSRFKTKSSINAFGAHQNNEVSEQRDEVRQLTLTVEKLENQISKPSVQGPRNPRNNDNADNVRIRETEQGQDHLLCTGCKFITCILGGWVNNVEVKILMDTGAAISMISEKVFNKLSGIPLECINYNVVGVCEEPMFVFWKCRIKT